MPVDKPVPQADPESTNPKTQDDGLPDSDFFPDRIPVTFAGDRTGPNLKQRFHDEKIENLQLGLGQSDVDIEDISGPANSTEVSDYGDLPKMNYGEEESSSFYAEVSYNGYAYEWFEVFPYDERGKRIWENPQGDKGRSSTGASQGAKTEGAVRHENILTRAVPDNTIVRMIPVGTGGYIFRTTLENTHGRNVLRKSPTGDEDESDAVSWRVDDQGGGHGFILPVTTGVSYNDEGDQKLYGYFVALEVSGDGRIVAVSQEQQYLINAPDAC